MAKQLPEEDIVQAQSRVSIATGVTASRESTLVDPDSPPESLHKVPLPEPLEELPEPPGIAEYNA